MSESKRMSTLLLPELEAELAKTRKMLEYVPDGANDFKSAEKSMPLSRLAGHTAELAGLVAVILTTSEIDMGTPTDPRKILRMDTQARLLADYDELAAAALTAMRNSTDDDLEQTWKAAKKGVPTFSLPRYSAYRNMAINHMIHHRAQLGVYLRLLGRPVPSTFGPTADEAA